MSLSPAMAFAVLLKRILANTVLGTHNVLLCLLLNPVSSGMTVVSDADPLLISKDCACLSFLETSAIGFKSLTQCAEWSQFVADYILAHLADVIV